MKLESTNTPIFSIKEGSLGVMAATCSTVTRLGLGYRAAVIQAGEGLPAYDFAVLSPPQRLLSIETELPPSSGDLVF